MEHSATSATGTAWERMPWHATQRAAPDPAGGWTFTGVGRFNESGVRAEVREIKGRLGDPTGPGNPDPMKGVPPG